MKSLVWFVPAFLVFLGILLLSTVLSIPVQIEGVGYTDKLSHLFAYFVLIVTLLFAFHKNGMLGTTSWMVLILACSLYGVALEFMQYSLFPNRYFEWLDALANVSGAIIGSLIFRLVSYVKEKQA
ncbi:MAG: VanZ family protein [Cyclobacteriaceae bacterium]